MRGRRPRCSGLWHTRVSDKWSRAISAVVVEEQTRVPNRVHSFKQLSTFWAGFERGSKHRCNVQSGGAEAQCISEFPVTRFRRSCSRESFQIELWSFSRASEERGPCVPRCVVATSQFPLPLSLHTCRCGRQIDKFGHHRALCAQAGVLGEEGSHWKMRQPEFAGRPVEGLPPTSGPRFRLGRSTGGRCTQVGSCSGWVASVRRLPIGCGRHCCQCSPL